MRCPKCGTSCLCMMSNDIKNCPFCGEQLMGNVPYQQAIEAFRMIIERYGVDIYAEEKRLYSLLNDILPNSLNEKNILKTAILLGVPQLILTVTTKESDRKEILKQGYELLDSGGLDLSWCAAVLYILAMPLGINTLDLYPLETKEDENDIDFKSISLDYVAQLEEEYSNKNIDDLISMALKNDVFAKTELGERYYFGIDVENNIDIALTYFTQAVDAGFPVAEYILGRLYDEGQSVPHDPVKAIELYQKSSKKGYSPAQYALGCMYYFGEACEKNDSEALYWLLKAADEWEDPDIYITLALIFKDSMDEDIRDEKKAFEYIKKAEEMGEVNAYNLLGCLYESGCGVQQDYDMAFHYYKLAAENGIEMAYLNLGSFYLNGIAVTKDEIKAVEYFQYGANVKNLYCLNALGMCYKNGIGVMQNYERAFELFFEAALAGNFAGEVNVGFAYFEGQGVLADKVEARKWFTLSAEHGCSKAMAMLGYYEEIGILNVEPDVHAAFEWYLKAAEVGDDPNIMWMVGNCYFQGLLDVTIDHCTAFNWYLKAAELGHATSQNNVACAYIKGEIVDYDYVLATEWFEKAVSQDDMYALNNYGEIMLKGDGIQQDIKRAFYMIKKSAEMGYAEAQFNLGVCYFEGWGTLRNLDEALKCLINANNAGVSNALEYLQKGFEEKNGTWSKRGMFEYIPAPEKLPTPTEPLNCIKGCKDSCEYALLDIAEEIYGSDVFCICKLVGGKVFRKSKCPYYKNVIESIFEVFKDE